MAISCDPGDLNALAKCFSCLTIPQLEAIQTYLLCQVSSGVGTFVSAQTDFSSASTQYVFAHGLSTKPIDVYAVMVNQSTDLSYVPGDEVDIHGVFSTSSGTEQFSVYANSTNVVVAFREAMPLAQADVKLTPAVGGVGASPDFTKWKLKVYAHT